MENEIWKDIIGYEGLYQASNLGKVRSIKFGKIKNIKPVYQKRNGYCNIGLYKKQKCKQYRLHRIICLTFLGDNCLDVNHKDGNKTNNILDNLEYCTKSYNSKHRFSELGQKPGNYGMTGNKSPLSKKVNQYDLDGNFIKTWDCMRDIKRELGLQSCNISKCCNGKRNKVGLFIWKFI